MNQMRFQVSAIRRRSRATSIRLDNVFAMVRGARATTSKAAESLCVIVDDRFMGQCTHALAAAFFSLGCIRAIISSRCIR